MPSSSLIPDDHSVLLTTAGMQQFKKYFTGELDAEKDFGGKNTVSIQKCFRTSDIDEVGDKSHLTFFEMLGNFSFATPATPERSDGGRGGYWKEDAIKYAHEFITKEMNLKIDYVSVFKGEEGIPADEESEKIWKSLGVSEIKKFGKEDNFWGPTGSEGPCGPTTEIYVNGIEIWNIVFNEYYMTRTGVDSTRTNADAVKLRRLKTPGVDTGMGLERLAMAVQKKPTIFETDLFQPLMDFLPPELPERTKRIIADHARGSVFLLAEGVRPANKETGYVLRRLLRRVFVYMHLNNLRPDTLEELIKVVIADYNNFYPELAKNKNEIINVSWAEYERFGKTIGRGIKELEKLVKIDAQSAFTLYESYGLPYEIIKEFGKERAKKLRRENFEEEFKKHQEISRAGSEKKFGGHGLPASLRQPAVETAFLAGEALQAGLILNTGELKAGNEEELKKVTRLHTATHLLQQALREVLSDEVHQMGSDITAERTRFDFSYLRKLTAEEIKKVEDLVNQKIKEDLPVSFKEMPIDEAKKTGALYFFKEKYPRVVKVYFVGNSLEDAWSKEFCGGPHVTHTGAIGHFKISKEEAIGAGLRRVRGILIE